MLFFSVYLPLTCVFGLMAGSFHAPGHDRSLSYELFLWFVVAVQLFVPTMLAFLVVLMLVKVSTVYAGATTGSVQRIAVLVFIASTLPTIQAVTWGAYQLSIDWFLVAVIPAGVLGYLVALPGKTSVS